MAPAGSAFDSKAVAYDSQFTASAIGVLMRQAVWARCAARFPSGSHVLEMNCGTGEDALWLGRRGIRVLATDASPAMLRIAGDKIAGSPGLAVRVKQLAWEELALIEDGPFDGMLSNFGGLNCVSDMHGAASALATKLRPGAIAILCMMGPVVPWEWAWFLAHGRPAKALRRLKRGGTAWSGIVIRYPSIRKTIRAFAPTFRVLRASAIGALLPPPYTDSYMRRHPRLIAMLNRLERRLETSWPLPMLADHYLLELERV